jgi:hypothetical protein
MHRWRRQSADREVQAAVTPRLSPASAQVSSTMQQTKQGLDKLWWYNRHYFLAAKVEALRERRAPGSSEGEEATA